MAKVIKEKQTANENQDAQALAGASGESIDQIREILFGTAQREHQSRMGQIEARVAQNAAEAADRLKKLEETLLGRLDKMANDFQSSIDQLSESLRQAQAEARSELKEAAGAPVHRVSAATGDGVRPVLFALLDVIDATRAFEKQPEERQAWQP